MEVLGSLKSAFYREVLSIVLIKSFKVTERSHNDGYVCKSSHFQIQGIHMSTSVARTVSMSE